MPKSPDQTEQQTGVEVIRIALETMPNGPGVYRMLDHKNNALYVGKARNLKKRVTNYTQLTRLVPRIQRMVMQTACMEITVTRTEAEALLLEASLIKNLNPRYNILLRDDKSFPYIAIDWRHPFPRILKHRGEKQKNRSYFGPYASAGDVNRAIAAIQKSFLLRPCSDSVFRQRERPCLEYQIRRCSAPCVGKISEEAYRELVAQAERFLSGKSQAVKDELLVAMEAASEAMDYEKAAIFRDRIRALTHIQAAQSLQVRHTENADIVGVYQEGDRFAVFVLFLRHGAATGSRSYFPSNTEGYEAPDVLEAFLGRFYQTMEPAPILLLSHDIPGRKVLEQALHSLTGRKVEVIIPQRGERCNLVEMVR
ncbi:MAG: excinuclease ABC subunit C, partial [Rickettsiales bacterium]|nr:excinuclease ABC subunit C [Rickettsiales bacterium]